MGESEGRSAGKTAGILASAIAVMTLVGALSKDAYDRYSAGRDKGDERRTARRQTLSRVSHLAITMADTRVALQGKAFSSRTAPSAATLDGYASSAKAVLGELKLGDHFRTPTELSSFEAYDKDINLAIRDGSGERAWNLYQLQDLAEETCQVLTIGRNLEDKTLRARWLESRVQSWPKYRGWIEDDLKALELKVDLPETIDPNDPDHAMKDLRGLQGVVQRAIDGGTLPE